jgi:hypothetical protein
VKRTYYFLASSLPELSRRGPKRAPSVEELLERCARELHPDDYRSLKALFLLNDVANAVTYRAPGDPFLSPSFFSQEELLAGRTEPERLLPFLALFFANAATGVRLHPALLEVDELTLLFYQRLDDIGDGFVRAYFRHELDLRNIAVALGLRQQSLPLDGRLIPIGAAYEGIAGGRGEDFGLSDSFPYVGRLVAAYRESSLTGREQALEEVRWSWLDGWLGVDWFSSDYVLAYLVRLRSIERWQRLRAEAGGEVFDELLNTVHRSVRFAIEFTKLGRGTAAAEGATQ